MRFGKKLLIGLSLLLLGLGVTIGVKTTTTVSRQPTIAPAEVPEFDSAAELALAQRLGGALRIPTVSREGQPVAAAELQALHAYLRTTFPALHAALKVETVGELSLLYTWPGKDPAIPPYLLLAHQDVVPVEAGSETRWTKPPFSGAVADGFVWGRGALDDKGSVLAILEGVERLVRAGFVPQRTVYFAFGHDEEVSGVHGARAIAALLRERGVHLDFVLDEGMLITDGMVPGARQPVALVGLAEKGYLSLELLAHSSGGHASIPPPHTAVGVLSRAVQRIEDHPFPTDLRPPANQLFAYVGPDLGGPLRYVFTNLWLLRPIVLWQLGQKVSTAAMIRTTTAATIFEGGSKDNVLPQRARAVVNFRILPGDTVAKVQERIRDIVDDPQVEIRPIATSATDPTTVSSDSAPSFQTLSRTIRSVFPQTLVGPTLMLGQSDSRYFIDVASSTYRFLPVTLQPEDIDRIHGTNERIGIKNYAESVRFYEQFVRNCDKER